MIRVRNEQTKIHHCLRSILPVFDEVVVLDNGSEDDTVRVVRQLQERNQNGDRIRLFSYPHRLARFGPEHRNTPENSVHSAVYYTNWALSHCSYRYVCKWDGDMVLLRGARREFLDLLTKIQTGIGRSWILAGQTVYRDAMGDFYLAKGEVNSEIRIFPNGKRCRFVKAVDWERLKRPFFVRKRRFAPVCFLELKFAGEDEFSHWSTRDWPSARKRREWKNYQLVGNGHIDGAGFERLGPTLLDDQLENW